MRGKRLILAATIIGSGIVFLDGTIVTLALPKIADSLHAGFSGLQWIADGYLLSLSALILVGGSLGDIFGRKKVFLLGLAGFGVTSLLCGLAPNTQLLVTLRICQGVFGALLVPASLAIINTNFPKKERGAAIGLWSAYAGAFTALGPLAGGYLLDNVSWRWIFFVNVPLVALCYVLAAVSIKDTKKARSRRLDGYGSVMAALALAGLTYGLIEGPVDHWKVSSMTPLLAGIVLLLGFIIYESRAKDPMLELRLFRSRNFTGSNLMTFAQYGALSGFMFVFVIYLQTKMHYSSIKAGVSMMPVTIILLFFSRSTGRLAQTVGPRLFMTTGPLLCAVAMFLLTDLRPGDNFFGHVLPPVILFAVGMVLLVAPLTTTVMTSVSERNSGIASAVNNAVSRVAGLIVIALLGLTGTNNTYRFGLFLCASFALAAGVISFITIKNPVGGAVGPRKLSAELNNQ